MDIAHNPRPLVRRDLENVLEEETLVGVEEHQARTRGSGACPEVCVTPPTRQGVKVGAAVWLLLWVTAAVTLAMVVRMQFAPRLSSVQEKDGSELLIMTGEDKRRMWPQTAVLLPAIANHYRVRHLTVHQPHSYETQNGRQAWHFTSLQEHLREQARADVILHTDVDGLQLTVKHPKSPITAHTSYTLSLTNITDLKSHVDDPLNISVPQNIFHLKQSSLPKVIKMLHDTWTVVDVTEYLQDWLFHESDLWVEVAVLHRLQEDAKGGYPVLLQPTVCVWNDHGAEGASKSGGYLKTALKVFLEARVQEKAAGRSWPDSKQHSENENKTFRQRNRRAIHSSQCKVQWVQVSKQELGLGLVVFPDTLILKYCEGICHILDHSDIFSTNALFRAKYRFLRKSASMPSPQCIPTSFDHQHFFVWDTHHIKMIKVWDLDAAKCGCR